MLDAQRGRFSAAMGSLGLAFDRVPTAERIRLYFSALRDLTIEEVEFAVIEAIGHLKFFPKAAELREYAMAMPRPKRVGGAAQWKQYEALLEELTPIDEQKQKWKEIAETLNRNYGTVFVVGEENGRPSMVSASRSERRMKR